MFRVHLGKTKKKVIGIALTATVIGGLILGNTFDFSGSSVSLDDGNPVAEGFESTLVPAFELMIDGKVIGTFSDSDLAESYMEAAKENVAEEIGYTPEYSFVSSIKEVDIEPELIVEGEQLMAELEKVVYDSLDEVLVKACTLKIDDFTVTVKDRETLEKVLKEAQSTYLQDDSAITVTMEQDEHNSMILTPEVHVLSKALPEDRTFVTSSMLTDGEPMEDLEASDEEFLETAVKDVVLEQEIIAVESYVSQSEIVDEATAVEMITKEHEQIKTYTVVQGDSPSVIAENNGISLERLYALNPGLKENARRMQIDDELIVVVPEPELYVTTVEDVVYSEIVDREVIYVNDPDMYVGEYSVIEAGSDGLVEVRATVTKRNGELQNQEITSEKLVVAPVVEKQLRGVKALPVTTATGTFEVPMLSYTFTSGYGYRWGRLHKGIDLAAPVGTAIKASDGGRIIQAGWDSGYGYSIEIDHGNGFTTKYGHCSQLYVSVGDEVSQYETIAAVGSTGNSTGPHCHFEIRINGTPVDPEKYVTP